MARSERSGGQASPRRRDGVVGVVILALVAAVASAGCLPEGSGPPAGASPEATSTTAASAAATPAGEPTTTSASQPPATDTPTSGAGPTAVAEQAVRSVTDGDTLVLEDGRRVRLAQVDAPETGACFGSQSTQALRALVEGRAVTVRRPENGPERDRYGRTLGEVSVAGRSVNEALVRSGAAGWYEEFAGEDAGLARRLRAAEDEAKRARLGQWSACASPASTTAAASVPAPTRALARAGAGCHPAYPGGCIPPAPPDLDCSGIRRRVRVDEASGDPHRLDADGDGWGCESYG